MEKKSNFISNSTKNKEEKEENEKSSFKITRLTVNKNDSSSKAYSLLQINQINKIRIKKILSLHNKLDINTIDYISKSVNYRKINEITKSIFMFSSRKGISLCLLHKFLTYFVDEDEKDVFLDFLQFPFFVYERRGVFTKTSHVLFDFLYKTENSHRELKEEMNGSSLTSFYKSYCNYMSMNIKIIILDEFNILNAETFSLIKSQYLNKEQCNFKLSSINLMIFMIIFTSNSFKNYENYKNQRKVFGSNAESKVEDYEDYEDEKEDEKEELIDKSNLLFSLFDYNSRGYIDNSDSQFKNILRIYINYCIYQSDYLINSYFSWKFNKKDGINRVYNRNNSDFESNNSIDDIDDVKNMILYKKYLLFMSELEGESKKNVGYMSLFINYISESLIFDDQLNIYDKSKSKLNKSSFLTMMNKTKFKLLSCFYIKQLFFFFIETVLGKESKLFLTELPKILIHYYNLSEGISNITVINSINHPNIKEFNMEEEFIIYDKLLNVPSNFSFFKSSATFKKTTKKDDVFKGNHRQSYLQTRNSFIYGRETFSNSLKRNPLQKGKENGELSEESNDKNDDNDKDDCNYIYNELEEEDDVNISNISSILLK